MLQIQPLEPGPDDSIECHLQQVGMGSLVCRATQLKGHDNTTNEVTPAICMGCPVGRIYREAGCDSALPRITIYGWGQDDPNVRIDGIFCKLRKRSTDLDYCLTCSLATAESTVRIVTSTRGLFQTHGFYTAYQDLEKARLAIRDGEFDRAITHSIASLESTLKIIHENLHADLPTKQTVTDLWKSARAVLELDTIVADEVLLPILNSLHGMVAQIGGLRNALSDAHGRGKLSPAASEAMAELALNAASTAATFIVRSFQNRERSDTA